MIIWSGLGFLAAVIIFACLLVCNLMMDSIWGKGYYSAHYWTIAMGMLAAAPIVWWVGNLLRKRNAQIVIDKATGKEMVLDRGNHHLFFIPMHLWGPLLVAIAAVLFILELINTN